MEVSDVLRDRVGEPGGFERMAAISTLAHAGLIAAMVLMPGRWFTAREAAPKPIMTVMLSGGNSGPDTGGVTSIGARPVQADPLAEMPKREPIRLPAVETKETVPIPTKTPAKPAAKPAPIVRQAPEQARGTTPTRGAETRAGTALAETGARGQGFGLSTSSGTGLGSRLDVGDFCCPDYIVTMNQKIRANWSDRAEVAGEAIVKYTIQRDGTITDAQLEKSSGYTQLDLNAQRAVLLTRQLPPLPAAFPNPTLTVHQTFQYSR
jgi:TonB family protein